MKRVLFITNYAAPYRVAFFDELGKRMDVTVLFSERIEDQKHRSADWFISGNGNCHVVQLQRRVASVHGNDLCLDVIHWLKKPWDAIVVCGYSSLTVMLAMAWLRLHRIPYYMEVDGGLIREDSRLKYAFKRFLVSRATWWIGSGAETTRYLVHYGAREERVFTYPFTSLWEKDILPQVPDAETKAQLRRELGIEEKRIAMYVGRVDPKKGVNDLLYALAKLSEDIGVYFVGGEPEESQLEIVKAGGFQNAHFVGFQKKDALVRYYMAADVLVLPTRSDVWGLVVNEAMACGLPVVSTDMCVAGMELVENGVTGKIIPAGDVDALAQAINDLFDSDYVQMGRNALERIRPYTIENMAKVHADIFLK